MYGLYEFELLDTFSMISNITLLQRTIVASFVFVFRKYSTRNSTKQKQVKTKKKPRSVWQFQILIYELYELNCII